MDDIRRGGAKSDPPPRRGLMPRRPIVLAVCVALMAAAGAGVAAIHARRAPPSLIQASV